MRGTALADRIMQHELREMRRRERPRNYDVTHASEIGHPCLRYLVYQRTIRDQAADHSDHLMLTFGLGNLHESDTIAILTAMKDVEIVQTQAGLWLPELELSGVADAIIRVFDEEAGAWTGPYVLEHKTCSPHAFAAYNTLDDLKKHPWSARYEAQVQCYLGVAQRWQHIDPRVPGDIAGGIILLRDKSSGQYKQLDVAPDRAMFDALCDKALRITGHVIDGTVPDRVPYDSRLCDGCEYVLPCAPPRWNEGAQFVIAGPLVEACETWELYKVVRNEVTGPYNKAWETIKEWAGHAPKSGFVVGSPARYHVTKHGRNTRVDILGVAENGGEDDG